MATERRVARVAEVIRSEVSYLLMNGIKDDRVGVGMVSITDVDVSGDLQHARIFVSIYGTPEAQRETMLGLKSATPFVRRQVGQRLQLRRTPEITFCQDESIERGSRVVALLSQLERERQHSQGVSDVLPPPEYQENDV